MPRKKPCDHSPDYCCTKCSKVSGDIKEPPTYRLALAASVGWQVVNVEVSVVISEPVEDFLLRNQRDTRARHMGRHFVLRQVVGEVDEKAYLALRVYNPSREGFFSLHQRDWPTAAERRAGKRE